MRAVCWVQLFSIVFVLFAPTQARSEAFADLYRSLPSKSQTTILVINIAHGVAQKCKIRFNRNTVFTLFENQLRQGGAQAPEIARTRDAFRQYSQIYDRTPAQNFSGEPCGADERERYVEMLRKMEGGVFPER